MVAKTSSFEPCSRDAPRGPSAILPVAIYIAGDTVHSRCKRSCTKLDVSCRTGLVALALSARYDAGNQRKG